MIITVDLRRIPYSFNFCNLNLEYVELFKKDFILEQNARDYINLKHLDCIKFKLQLKFFVGVNKGRYATLCFLSLKI